MTTLGPGGKLALLGDVFDPANTGAGLSTFDGHLGITGNAPIFAGLHSAFPASVQSDNELSYAGTTPYTRFQMARNSSGAVWTVDQVNFVARNVAAITFPSHSVGGAPYPRWLSFGVASSGATKIIARTPIMATGSGWLTANCVDTSAAELCSVSIEDYNAYGLAEGDEIAVVRLSNTALPSPLSSATAYFVKTGTRTVGTYGVTFQLATVSAAGTAVNFTSTAHFRMCKVTPMVLGAGDTPSFPALSVSFAAA
jgi:hypothetical protein